MIDRRRTFARAAVIASQMRIQWPSQRPQSRSTVCFIVFSMVRISVSGNRNHR
jgi:hypothetical protein